MFLQAVILLLLVIPPVPGGILVREGWGHPQSAIRATIRCGDRLDEHHGTVLVGFIIARFDEEGPEYGLELGVVKGDVYCPVCCLLSPGLGFNNKATAGLFQISDL